MNHYGKPFDREEFTNRLAHSLRDIHLAHGDFVVCYREAETLRDLEDVAGAIADAVTAFTDAQEQCRMRIAAIRGR